MPRYSIEYTIKGRIEIDAPSDEDAYEKANDMDYDKLVNYSDDIDFETTSIEVQEDYRDDENE